MKFVATVGVYDGVHVAHTSILRRLSRMSKVHRVESVVFTILYPPEYYRGDFRGLLIDPQERLEILQEYVDSVIFLDLNEVMDLEAEEFFENLVEMGVVGLVVGDDFRFGKGGRGDVETLKDLCLKRGVDLEIIEEMRTDTGERISSSLIRDMVSRGEVEDVVEYLGRYYAITGKVYRDLGLGRRLGFPTANLDRGHEMLVKPKSGVYFSRVFLPDGRVLFGLTNIGTRPTIVGEDTVKYETHVLDFEGDLYGKRLKVELLEYMREERKFENLSKLREAIASDVERAREMVRKWSGKL